MVNRRREDEARGRDWTEDELSDSELEEVAGGLATVIVPLCAQCQKRIAVHEMNICAACFVKSHSSING